LRNDYGSCTPVLSTQKQRGLSVVLRQLIDKRILFLAPEQTLLFVVWAHASPGLSFAAQGGFSQGSTFVSSFDFTLLTYFIIFPQALKYEGFD
jgi:hypothetical protein